MRLHWPLQPLKRIIGPSRFPLPEPEEAILAELFGIERLAQHAERLAVAQRVTPDPRKGHAMLPRIRENGRVLRDCYRALAEAIREERAITPAAEWLVDNFHIVEDQLREIREDLPLGFYRQLPKLAAGDLEGYPRVFGLAWTLVAHSDSRFDPEALRGFVRAYQRVQPLTIGEIWAVPITLRVVLVENLRRCAQRMVRARAERQQADAVADALLGLAGGPAANPAALLRPFEEAPLPRSFAVQLIQRLRDQRPSVAPALLWLDRRLAAQGMTADEIVSFEHRRQAVMNVTIRNVITSMRLLTTFEWTEFFESVSLVDEALRAESDFAAMEFATRDRYRHAIEEISRGSRRSELEVAKLAILRAKRGGAAPGQADDPHGDRGADPGYHLIAAGRAAFEKEIGYRVPFKHQILRAYIAAATPGYLGTIGMVSALILALLILSARESGGGALELLLLGLLGLLPASDLAVALVNRYVLAVVKPMLLPKLELGDGVPAHLRTMVVVPTLLTSRLEIEEQIARLEVHYLANPDGELHFALLSDWTDAPAERMPGDDDLLAAAVGGLASLNARHGPTPSGGERFLLFHRRRLWNRGEGKWMGWERKRGKLHELNRLLRGDSDTTFLSVGGQPPVAPAGVRYVITLDADTRLPMAAAYQLVGTMAHPLNRPRFDPRAGRVVEGYAVLQPRITPALPADRESSLFQRIFSGPSGIDPYAFAVSDVYQDLYGEGSYTGKGIFDVDAFEEALKGRVPENALLSHDLFEGLLARAGLVTDVELLEEFPSHYEVAAARQHRWIRGDWQLLPWIIGRGAKGSSSQARMAIPMIGKWKMLDNLRRSLSAPASLLTLVVGWAWSSTSPVVWTTFILLAIAVPTLLPVLIGLLPRRRGIAKRHYVRAVGTDLALATWQIVLAVTLLAHQAWRMGDAIVRALARLYVTRRKLLEWVTAAQAKSGLSLDIIGFYRRMGGAVAVPVVAGLLIALVRHQAWPVAIPFCILWALSPLVARWVSLPPLLAQAPPLSGDDVRTFRLVARRTWRFFETFVGPEDHALPPDNFQEEPHAVVAHRTSPTNIGLYLLSAIAARDFGWLGTGETVERLEATFGTLSTLERFRGHFYNWYDTRDLRPLEPKYVSSVDSGNLAGHLIVLGQACREMIHRPLLGPEMLRGIEDAADLVRESTRAIGNNRDAQTVTRRRLDEALASVAAASQSVPVSAGDWALGLTELSARAHALAEIARTLAAEWGGGTDAEVDVWAEAARVCIDGHLHDLDTFAPWARLMVGDVMPGPARAIMERFLSSLPTLADTPDRCQAARDELISLRGRLAIEHPEQDDGLAGIDRLLDALEYGASTCKALVRRLSALAQLAKEMVEAMQFDLLFDPTRKLFSTAYRINDASLEPSYYDLLASEARFTSFVAIVKGDVPPWHWFRLGRALTPVARGAALISWSGSMFEYLMPALVMRSPSGSLLEQAYRLVVRRQMQYGAQRGVPWGISESAYNLRDVEMIYQYSNFGVPGLGLARGLSEDLVIAPYATALAAMIDPAAAVRNFARLADAGARGRYGFYEALDYTRVRLPEGTRVVVVRAYMAHHQGMSIVAIANVLQAGAMRARFHAEPMVQAAELLLQERTPRDVAVARPRAEEVKASARVRDLLPPTLRRITSPHGVIPQTHLLSNGRYVVMMTAAGSGYSRWRDLAVTRWREDRTRDPWGSYIFLRDTESGEVWSAGYQPSGVEPDSYEVTFSEHRVEILRRDGAIETGLEVVISPEDDAEVRRVSLKNLGMRTREIELTSYAEIVLTRPAAEAAHPAFANLFVQTEAAPQLGALFATRRPSSASEPQLWLAHVVAVEGEVVGGVQYETDRAQFLGRGREVRTPMAIVHGRPLSNTVGSVLDPIFSLRCQVRVPPGSTARLSFSTLVAPSREEALSLADKYKDPATFERTVTLAWTQAQVQLRHFGIGPDEAHLFQRLANRILYLDPATRPSVEESEREGGGQSALWAHGISGDIPIVLVRIDESEGLGIVRQLLRAHEYWQMKWLAVDLVILNEQPDSYVQELQASLEELMRTSQPSESLDGHEPGGRVYFLRSELLSSQTRDTLQTAARAVLRARDGTLGEQLARPEPVVARVSPAQRPAEPQPLAEAPSPPPEVEFFNGLGGFADDGREYVTILGQGQWSPAPWINVVANPSFGFQVSESGSGYTWSVNSRQYQLTPWSNDPLSDPPGEVIYVRDEETGELWGPTALPIRIEEGSYVARHGQGYTRFEHASHGVSLHLLQFVPPQDSVKISRLTIENHSGRVRSISVIAYAEWVLGPSRSAAAPLVVTEIDEETGAMLARNGWNAELAGRVAFADLRGRQTAWTADRTEFLGRNGTLQHPAALERGHRLSGAVGGGLDPCAALQATLELPVGGRAEIVFLLGDAATREEARSLVARYRTVDLQVLLDAVREHWDSVCGALQVKTPERAMDMMLNRWLLYQALSCRVWARSALYQVSGAYGFRDQLQDVMALALSKWEVAREHLLLAAGRQFLEGDVQHWWHQHSGWGLRTRISDDLLWLPYAVLHYLDVTGDMALLEETVPFVEGPALSVEQREFYSQPAVSEQRGTLFEHCARALDRSLAVGSHGLPLMGTGDWNDGMNRVGHEGRGESVWLGWFLCPILREFARLADLRGEQQRAERWRRHLSALQASLELAWDGNWYRRAYFDDGTPLGSAMNEECRIDSIAQSWAVISGSAEPSRAARAMAAVEEYLVRPADGLVLLLTPPFERTSSDPGYIRGYVPGVRENGGQYTHASIWAVVAFAELGDGDRAGELFSVLNPINHAGTPADVDRYMVEPYVVAADIYAEPPHVGRGGWTWYTGSAGWMYRAGIEWILGFHLRGTTLGLDPCIPRSWSGFQIVFRYGSARYEIDVENPRGVSRGVSYLELDGGPLADSGALPLSDDGATHHVRVVLG